MSYVRLHELLGEEFKKKLSVKTGWGRNEILLVFNEAWTTATVRMIEEREQQHARESRETNGAHKGE